MLRRLLLVGALLVGLLGFPAGPASADQMSCPVFTGTIYPGGEMSRRCTIINLGPVDATFYTFVPNPRVLNAQDNDVTNTPDGQTFLGFFSWSQQTQIVATAHSPLPTRQGEQDDVDLLSTEQFRTTCDHKALSSMTGDPNDFEGTHCRVGRVRRSTYLPPGFNRRDFIETLHMADQGDQSRFAGWAISFSETFRARVPAASECPQSGCTPVYER